MSTRNIGFYEEIINIIPKLSSNTLLICSTGKLFCVLFSIVIILGGRSDNVCV